MIGKQMYFDVLVISQLNNYYTFDSCKAAATWLFEQQIARSVNAAKVGISNVLTGKRQYYRHLAVTAERRVS